MRPYDSVILKVDLPEYHLTAGTSGAVVENYPSTDEVVMVEFFDPDGNTLEVVDVRVDQMTVTLPDFSDGETVALLQDIAQPRLMRGQVGIIQKRSAVGIYEIEFTDSHGKPFARASVEAHHLMRLLWEAADVKRTA